MASYVISASVYVDEVDSPADATEAVEAVNHFMGANALDTQVQIRLPDPGSDHVWEELDPA
jgi:hypothetical protein